jgi:hypothetical protein
MGIKIRGIYSTALTKILSDGGYDIALPLEEINHRMDLENNSKASTLIYDKEDMDGVILHGKESEEIIEALRKELGDFITKKVETGDIYRGIIKKVDMDSKEILVDIGKEKNGILSLREYWGFLREGQPILVQTKGKNRDHYLLSCHLRFFGENLVLIKGGFTKPSKHIKDKEEMRRLMDLSKDAKLNGWGILWKSLAEGKTNEVLKAEIDDLTKEEQNIKEVFEKGEKPEMLKEGFSIYFLDFPKDVKEKLDDIRNQLLPTVKGHHFLKAGGLTMLAELADRMVEEEGHKKVGKCVEDIFRNNMNKGNFYKIIHKKSGGDNIVMFGRIEEVGDEMKIYRRLRYRGELDGLDTRISDGDYAITTIKQGSVFVKHEYFKKNNEPIGKYFSVNTPMEIYPKIARYMDLEVDVVEKDGKREIIDREKLEKSNIPEGLKKMALKTAEMIVKGDTNV